LLSGEAKRTATNDPKGFLTTFTLLGRESFTLAEMSWILIKVFFGSSYLGFVSPQTPLVKE